MISEKVGATIEPAERDKYGLFRNVKNFQSATFYELNGGGYEVEIMTAEHRYIAVNRDSLSVQILRDYIDNYETIKDSIKRFEKKWHIITYDTLGQPITRYEVGRIYYTCCCAGGLGLAMPFGSAIVATFGEIAYTTIFFFTDWKEVDRGLLAMGSALAGGLAGFLVGNMIDISQQQSRLKAIKEARKPRVVE